MANPALTRQEDTSLKKRLTFLGGALVLLAAAALLFRHYSLQNLPPLNPLYGNEEAAGGALSALLKKTPAPQRLPMLLKDADSPYPGLRYAAIDDLRNSKSKAAEQAVTAGLYDCDSEVRKRALEVLPSIDMKMGTRMMAAALQDQDPWIREDAASQLNQISYRYPDRLGKGAVPSLMASVDDADPNVAVFSMQSLHFLTHKPWHVSLLAPLPARLAMAKRWKEWWKSAKAQWPSDSNYQGLPSIAPTRMQPCPDFAMQMVKGSLFNRDSLKGHITLLTFWGEGCPPCDAEQPDLNQIWHRFRGTNVQIIGACAGVNMQPSAVREYCRKHAIEPPQAIASPTILRAFNDIDDVPDTYLIDQNGNIRQIWQGGPRSPEPYTAAIEGLLKGQNAK